VQLPTNVSMACQAIRTQRRKDLVGIDVLERLLMIHDGARNEFTLPIEPIRMEAND
jgi:hypothetical protein